MIGLVNTLPPGDVLAGRSFFFQAEDGIRDKLVTGVQTCALPISSREPTMSDTPPVILIGLDAAEIEVVDRLVADGRMPNLARLRQQGRWGRLQTEPPHCLSLVWSTFFCGTRLGEQGWYFNKIWNPDRQRLQYVDPAWLALQPF